MAYKGLENNTPFYAELTLLADEYCRDIMLLLVKATYDITSNGELFLAKEQQAINFEGEFYGKPGESSLKFAPEANFTKLATDVAVIGNAIAPYEQAVTTLDVGVKIGSVQQHIKVIGDRVWQKRKTGKVVNWISTPPEAFTKMPLVYERAFGGKDLTPEEEKYFASEPRNLVGTGIIAKHSTLEEVAMPNLEDPRQLIKSATDRPQPMGVGFISPDWQPRLAHAGTYDESWEKKRMPLLPEDFNRKFFNAGHPALQASGFLQGNETVMLVNMTSTRRFKFNLPGEKPNVQFKFSYENPIPATVDLDTVLINTDDMQVSLLWRANQNVYNRIYDVEQVFLSETLHQKTAIN